MLSWADEKLWAWNLNVDCSFRFPLKKCFWYLGSLFMETSNIFSCCFEKIVHICGIFSFFFKMFIILFKSWKTRRTNLVKEQKWHQRNAQQRKDKMNQHMEKCRIASLAQSKHVGFIDKYFILVVLEDNFSILALFFSFAHLSCKHDV